MPNARFSKGIFIRNFSIFLLERGRFGRRVYLGEGFLHIGEIKLLNWFIKSVKWGLVRK